MDEIYLSNLNAAAKIAAYDEEKQRLLAGRLEDAESMIDGALVIMAWRDGGHAPDCTIDYLKLMIDPNSESNSSFRTSSSVNPGLIEASLSVSVQDDVKQIAKFVLIPGCCGYDASGSSMVNVPLVAEIVEWTSSGPKIKPVNGRKTGSQHTLPQISSNSRIVLLTDKPEEIPDSISKANVILLEADCPALKSDAKRGDVFCFFDDQLNHSNTRNSAFFKCFAFEEKVAAMKRLPKKLIPHPSKNGIFCRAYMVSSLDFENLGLNEFDDEGHQCMYVLLLKDIEVSEKIVSGQGSTQTETTKVTEYKKGSFIFAEYDEDADKVVFTKVPFDTFFK